ncbi:MAG: AAA family ATPase [Flavobacteriales bacterium]|nr:AAA family ATPase [Flavobacteriales bacterium]
MQHEETEMAALAARFVNSTGRHVFLTGKAGTGKTTFLHVLAASTHKRFIILAPTGIAALNAKGVTIHSQFLLPFGAFVPERTLPPEAQGGAFTDQHTLASRHPLNALRRQVLREVDLLIIDEVSMLRADLLDAIDYRMRAAKGVQHKSFGGAQVLLIGDLYQLPPVVKDAEWQVMKRWYKSAHFFEARALALPAAGRRFHQHPEQLPEQYRDRGGCACAERPLPAGRIAIGGRCDHVDHAQRQSGCDQPGSIGQVARQAFQFQRGCL